MPVPDVDAVAGKIRENPASARLPILDTTGYAMQGNREKILNSGFEDTSRSRSMPVPSPTRLERI